MSFSFFLYMILIYPLELIFEFSFGLFLEYISNPGTAIICLSLSFNLLVLPLYMRADIIQKEERDIEEKLSAWVKHIKSAFKGDERFMMLQAYYRLNDYKPAYILKSTFPILLQVPFFVAAYRFLSKLELLKGVPFGFIRDLGSPDAVFMIGGFTVNILPILMTLINILSGSIYTRGATLKNKIQVYGIAILFLVFLYNSPSGLVLYWLLNNIFSLVKNLLYRLHNPLKVIQILTFCLGFFIILYMVNKGSYTHMQQGFVITVFSIMQLLFLAVRYKKLGRFRISDFNNKDSIFWFSALYLSVITGILIPSSVIKSSVAEFVDTSYMRNPSNYIMYSSSIAVGLFIIWIGIYYCLTAKDKRWIYSYAYYTVCVICTLNYMCFGADLGNLSSGLQYDIIPIYSVKECLINLSLIVCACIVCWIIFSRFPHFMLAIIVSGLIASVGMSVHNLDRIFEDYNSVNSVAFASEGVPSITLSKNNRNVVVIMMDRMIGYFVPYIMQEDLSLHEKYDGFTFYPNTISYGNFTNVGTPALYGGYEYTPKKMNERDTELLVDKHNEALKVMPVLFLNNGFDVTVWDPSYAGYEWIPDLNIYNEYPDIKRYITEGKIASDTFELNSITENSLNRDFFCFSIFKVSPVIAQTFIYNKGKYFNLNSDYNGVQILEDDKRAVGLDKNFMESYNVIDNLPNLTNIVEGSDDYFCMIANHTTHCPVLLQMPNYIPQNNVDNSEFSEINNIKHDSVGNKLEIDTEYKITHYHVNIAAMEKIGDWLDYLREKGVYDNTRIIIVSDHGQYLGLNQDLIVDRGKETELDPIAFNCVLLVKDFGASSFTVDNSFMTNADTPTIATEGVITSPQNPFTGEPINSGSKETEPLEIIRTEEWRTDVNNGYKFLPSPYYTVHDNIFDPDNWNYLGNY